MSSPGLATDLRSLGAALPAAAAASSPQTDGRSAPHTPRHSSQSSAHEAVIAPALAVPGGASSTPVTQTSTGTSSVTDINVGVRRELERRGPAKELTVDADVAALLQSNPVAPANGALREHLARLGFLRRSADGVPQQELIAPLPTSADPKSYLQCSAKEHEDWLAAVCHACDAFDAPPGGQHDEAWVSVAQLQDDDSKRITQEIDVALARRSGLDKATSGDAQDRGMKLVKACDVSVVMEAKLRDGFEEQWVRQVARYARLINEHSPARPFRVAVGFSKTDIVLFRFGCGAYFKRAFRRTSAPTPEMMLGLVRWCRRAIQAPLIAKNVEGGKIELAEGGNIRWDGKPRLLFAKNSLFGSLTSVWRIEAIDEAGKVQPKILKLAWCLRALANREQDIYEHLALRSPNSPVPRLCRDLSGVVGSALDVGDDRHSLVAVVLEGEPLAGFEGCGEDSLLTLVRGVRDAARIIWWLERNDVHHRDISTGNFQRQREPNGGFDHGTLDQDWLLCPHEDDDGAGAVKGALTTLTSTLIDFGGARKTNDPTAGSSAFRSGTWEFLARTTYENQRPESLADDAGVPRHHRSWHDLESLANVFYWLLICHFVGDAACREDRLVDWKHQNPGAGHQLWAPRAFDSTFSLIRRHLTVSEAHRQLVESLLRGMHHLIEASVEHRRRELMGASDAAGPAIGRPAWLKAVPSPQIKLRADHEAFPALDRSLFSDFVALCNWAVREWHEGLD